jgi:hypothetical protein
MREFLVNRRDSFHPIYVLREVIQFLRVGSARCGVECVSISRSISGAVGGHFLISE